MNTIHETVLANGLTVRFLDKTQRYFGDYHHVRLEVVCDVPVPEGAGAESSACRSVQYKSSIRRFGVPTVDVPAAIEGLVSNFTNTTMSYMSSPSFPSRYLRSQLSDLPRRGNVEYTPGF